MLPYSILLVGYLLGSIPFGLLLTRMTGGGDIRAIGSGNIGATNVLRTGNKSVAALTLLLDMLKGTLAVVIAFFFAPHLVPMVALAVLLGHMFPVWLYFNGGKGVATAYGVMIALCPPVALWAMLIWLCASYFFRISSASALLSLLSLPLFMIIYEQNQYIDVTFVVMSMVLLKHMSNINRMLDGVEPRIGEKKHNDPQTSDAA